MLDTALSVQVEALAGSRYEPIHFKARKLLDEERFHFEHGRGWTLRLAAASAGRTALADAFRKALEPSLRWYGKEDDDAGLALVESGVVDGGPEELRTRWVARIAPVLREASLGGLAGELESGIELDWSGWDAGRRRTGEGGPDPETLSRIRGDRNRSMLMD
jgi:1,2-phenylacetyl-CoA epoxidase catalytic subunit